MYIPVEAIEEVKKRIEKYNKKWNTEVTYTIDEPVFQTTTSPDGNKVSVMRSWIELHAPQVRTSKEGVELLEIVSIKNDTEHVTFKGTEEFIPYRNDELVVIAAKDHPLAQFDAIDFKQSLDYEFVCLENTSAMQRFIFEKARMLGCKIVPRVQVGQQSLLIGLVSQGAGIAVLSGAAARAFELKNARIIKLTNAWAQRRLRIAVSAKYREQSRWLEPLIDVLVRDAPKEN